MEKTRLFQGIDSTTFKTIHDRAKTTFILGIIFLVVVLAVFITVIVMVMKRSHLQSLRQRSPKLMLLSTWGNFLFAICLLIQGIFFSGCLMESDVESGCIEGICNNKAIA